MLKNESGTENENNKYYYNIFTFNIIINMNSEVFSEDTPGDADTVGEIKL